ncbi:MAG: outer membrane lipoprotein-sorting protein [Lentisphaeria bacterium]|nr:outer membrane lipoprotein-sorting protein [Lentisphaeria bacterium]
MDDLYRSASSTARIEMVIVKARVTRTMTMKAWSRGTERSLILVTDPPREQGFATLKVDQNLWSYQPRIRRTIRVPPSMMLSSWMGSDFTHDDMVREFRLSRDYDGRLLGRAEDGRGWEVELAAKPDLVGLWLRIVYTVNEDGSLPLGARYYDRRDRLARILVFDEVRELDGRGLPAHMLLQPVDRDGRPIPDQRTELRYLELDLDAEVPDSMFSLSALERVR